MSQSAIRENKVDKAGLLKSIATTGYNVGFGAKKHFATYDIVEKAPGWIGFISSAVGVLALIYDSLSAKLPSAILVILGICTFYINPYKAKQYDTEGRGLTQIFNELRDLYRAVQGGADLTSSHEHLKALETRYYQCGLSKQILFSDWYAHYKFFEQQQIDWIDEQLKFTWKDKFPLSFQIFAAIAALVAISGLIAALRI
jgi:hypothetical protein